MTDARSADLGERDRLAKVMREAEAQYDPTDNYPWDLACADFILAHREEWQPTETYNSTLKRSRREVLRAAAEAIADDTQENGHPLRQALLAYAAGESWEDAMGVAHRDAHVIGNTHEAGYCWCGAKHTPASASPASPERPTPDELGPWLKAGEDTLRHVTSGDPLPSTNSPWVSGAMSNLASGHTDSRCGNGICWCGPERPTGAATPSEAAIEAAATAFFGKGFWGNMAGYDSDFDGSRPMYDAIKQRLPAAIAAYLAVDHPPTPVREPSEAAPQQFATLEEFAAALESTVRLVLREPCTPNDRSESRFRLMTIAKALRSFAVDHPPTGQSEPWTCVGCGFKFYTRDNTCSICRAKDHPPTGSIVSDAAVKAAAREYRRTELSEDSAEHFNGEPEALARRMLVVALPFLSPTGDLREQAAQIADAAAYLPLGGTHEGTPTARNIAAAIRALQPQPTGDRENPYHRAAVMLRNRVRRGGLEVAAENALVAMADEFDQLGPHSEPTGDEALRGKVRDAVTALSYLFQLEDEATTQCTDAKAYFALRAALARVPQEQEPGT